MEKSNYTAPLMLVYEWQAKPFMAGTPDTGSSAPLFNDDLRSEKDWTGE